MAKICNTTIRSIPLDTEEKLLPSKSTCPIMDFIIFPLPPILTSSQFTHPSDYFDDQPASSTTTAACISNIPCPPATVVKALATSLDKQDLNDLKLVKCPHDSSSGNITYPLWLITYWQRIIHIHGIQDTWASAVDNLQHHQLKLLSLGRADDMVNHTFDLFGTLNWLGSLRGFSRNAEDDVEILCSYLSEDWLKGEHANQMLDLLCFDLQEHNINSVEIESTWFYGKIEWGYANPTTYSEMRTYRWPRQQGHAMATGIQDQLAFLANINHNHWVAIVLDFPKTIIWYGDPLGGQFDQNIIQVLDWWTHLHSGKAFIHKKLPITLQDDYHSCCLLAWNALATFLLPRKYELMNASDVANGRL